MLSLGEVSSSVVRGTLTSETRRGGQGFQTDQLKAKLMILEKVGTRR